MEVLRAARRCCRFYGLTLEPVRYRSHRLGGLFLLLSYPFAWFAYCWDYDRLFLGYYAPLWPACAGFYQSVSATLTFTFLPKMKNSGALSGYRGMLSYLFVQENVFYQALVLFWVCHYLFKGRLEATAVGRAAVCGMTFLPFTVVRPLFPVTPFEYDADDAATKKRRGAEDIYKMPDWVVAFMRYSYLVLKHVMYFGFNYRCFLVGGYQEQKDSWPVVLAFVGGLNWLFFQHTLVLRRIVSPLVAEAPLAVIILLTLLYLPRVLYSLCEEPRILALSLLGIFWNVVPYYTPRVPRRFIHAHYLFAMCVAIELRCGAFAASAARRLALT